MDSARSIAPTAGGRPDSAARLSRAACALLIAVALGAEPLLAQPFRLPTAPPASLSPEAQQSFEAKIDELARALANDPRLKRLAPDKRRGLVEFVVGNILFVAAHELGHALLSEMKLPALVGVEQAADDFAVLTALKHGEKDFSDRILIEAAKGWFVSGRRGTKAGGPLDYYARHGLDERRGYRIVCLLVGADPARFKALAEETQLPADRRRRCGWDYDRVTRAWERALAPHRRAAEQPKTRIDAIYGNAKRRLGVYAQTFRNLRFLETIAELAADRLAWPAPLVLEMRTCGQANAGWTAATRRLHICYELARDFAELYRDFADDRNRATRRRD
jgi:Putative metallopeptidase